LARARDLPQGFLALNLVQFLAIDDQRYDRTNQLDRVQTLGDASEQRQRLGLSFVARRGGSG
jgi:hypothetical protein